MHHYVVIEIERQRHFLKLSYSVTINTEILDKYKADEVEREQVPCWNILYKAPIEYDELSSVRGPKDAEAFHGCEVWLEQNKAPGSKYAIMKMYIVS